MAILMRANRYNEDYRAFVRLWKDVLAEKKELNTKVQHMLFSLHAADRVHM